MVSYFNSFFFFGDFFAFLWLLCGFSSFSFLIVFVFSIFIFFFLHYTFFFFLLDYLFLIIIFLAFILPILIAVAYYTLAERKIMASVQRRKGPNVVGFFGLLQPLADGLKLILKESIIPRKANFLLFVFSPVLTFALSLLLWLLVPMSIFDGWLDSPFGLLYIFAISSLSIFGIIGAGWASNSKYAVLGALRSAAQMISYEISLGFIFLTISLFSESLSILDILLHQQTFSNIWICFPLAFVFFISALAETNRAPFDLPEAEAEIVAGYNIEYSGIKFALFFLGEYSNMLIMSALMVLLFFGSGLLITGGWFIFSLKVAFFASIFVLVRATLPRVRYDQLMYLGWQVFLPLTLAIFFFFLSLFFLDDLFFYWDDINYSSFYYDVFTFIS